MEKYRSPGSTTPIGTREETPFTVEEALQRIQSAQVAPEQVDMRRILARYQAEKERRIRRRKWSGRLSMVVGVLVLLGSCPLYVLAATPWVSVGYGPLLVSLGLVAGGYMLSSWRPQFKETHEALLAAIKFGNHLTAPRLALEMDCSLDKAEKIIQELVRSGVAEIDLDQRDPDGALNYRIRGL